MTLHRGDIVLARFPHAAGGRGKKRPVLVVQDDSYTRKTRHVIVAEITTNVSAAGDPANLFVDTATPDGKATGLTQNSVISCLHLATMTQDRIDRRYRSAACCDVAASG